MTTPTSPADTLREAATLIRERANAATPGPWHVCDEPEWSEEDGRGVCGPAHEPIARLAEDWYEPDPGEPTAENDADHIASWHPAVALAVADWLEQMARAKVGTSYGDLPFEDSAYEVARTYLGRDQ